MRIVENNRTIIGEDRSVADGKPRIKLRIADDRRFLSANNSGVEHPLPRFFTGQHYEIEMRDIGRNGDTPVACTMRNMDQLGIFQSEPRLQQSCGRFWDYQGIIRAKQIEIGC